MATKLELPALGNSMEEGVITRWFKAEGDYVEKGEALYEVMTDKVNMEVEAPEAGILRRIVAEVDATVSVNGLVAILAEPGEEIASLLGGQAADAVSETPQEQEAVRIPTLMPSLREAGEGAGRVFASPRARRYADEYGIDIRQLAGCGTGVDGRVVESDVVAFYEEQQSLKKSQRISPLAAKVAAAHGMTPAEILGSGARGKVTQEDVRRSMEPPHDVPAMVSSPSESSPSESSEGQTVIKLIGMRRMVADAVTKSAQTAPHVTLTLAVDMSEAMRFRQQVLPAIEKSHGVRVSFTDIIAKASAKALQDHPYLNSTLAGNEITLYKSVHMGIAVSLGADGLIVPVVKDTQSKSLGDFSAVLKDLVAKAKDGKLASDEVTGGTFSITNLGTFGITQFNPIINPPQAAILGVCAIQDTLVPVNGQPQVRPMMNLCLSFDHRVIDGAPAAAFLARLKEVLEQPYLMFA
jgi:pyruvate dehydrogenase E2 component (dihydrolipoamide acetyltransferase)